MFGGVRFGGTLTLEQAFALGFDHVALCLGAGKPTILDMPHQLAPGVRMASDFLMALQLTGAAKAESIANLQLRLPAVVIGGGLTAIDTATEALAYYPRQVEKFLGRFETLAAERGEAAVRAAWTPVESRIAEEFIAHARAIRAERVRAAAAGEAPRLTTLMDEWGGVTIAYRRRMIDSPSYTLNHEEVEKALQEGIRFAEGLTPTEIQVDEAGHAAAICLKRADGSTATLPARAVLVAAGTRPNTVLAREDAEHFALDGQYFSAVDLSGEPVTPERLAKPAHVHVLHQIREDGRAVSFFGDLHPSFAGNVVKAMGGVKQGWPVVAGALAGLAQSASPEDPAEFTARMNHLLRPHVVAVNRLTPTIVEVVVRAPAGRAEFPSRRVLPPAEFRDPGRPRGRNDPGHGGSRSDRRLDRAGERARRHHRAGDGRLLRSLHAAEAGRAGHPHGADGHAHRDAGWRDGAAGRWRPRQCRALLHRPRLQGGGLARPLLRRLQAPAGPLQGGGDRGRGRCRGLGLGRGAGLHSRPAPGQGDRRQYRAGHDRLSAGRAGAEDDRSIGGRPHHRHRLRRHDGRRRPRAA